jgi:methylated-DNA-[protein]-cysteine S-methyltransferase
MSDGLFDEPTPVAARAGGAPTALAGAAGLVDPEHAAPHPAVADDLAVGSLETPVGRIWIAVSSVGLAAVGWRDPTHRVREATIVSDHDRLRPALEQLAAYFDGKLRSFHLELDLRRSTKAQRLVLQTLYDTVPYGSSVTYGELAHRSHSGVPARGIGAIMGANPIPVVVPCHRVLAQDGLGGYSGGRTGEGLHTKRWLLTLEGVLQPTLDWPQNQ